MNEEIAQIQEIVAEELLEAEKRICSRLVSLLSDNDDDTNNCQTVKPPLKPLPDNENYAKALEMYKADGTHSGVARELGVSILTAKRYFNWLVINGYLDAPKEELSQREKDVVKLLFENNMSLRQAAEELGCSINNVVYFRNSALRKGYTPPEK